MCVLTRGYNHLLRGDVMRLNTRRPFSRERALWVTTVAHWSVFAFDIGRFAFDIGRFAFDIGRFAFAFGTLLGNMDDLLAIRNAIEKRLSKAYL